MVFLSYRGSCCAPEVKKARLRVTSPPSGWKGLFFALDPGAMPGPGLLSGVSESWAFRSPAPLPASAEAVIFSFSIGNLGQKNGRLHRGIKCKRPGERLFLFILHEENHQSNDHHDKLSSIHDTKNKKIIHADLQPVSVRPPGRSHFPLVEIRRRRS